MQNSTFIELDVHKAKISVAIAQDEHGGEVRHWGAVPHRSDHVHKLVEKLAADRSWLHFCYEAGPRGYGLYRQIVEMGHHCIVVAPWLIPMKAGYRVKTDRGDAVMLAKLHRAGELTAVCVPDAAHEAMRDLVQARATAIRVAGKARQHLQGCLLRHSWIYPSKKGWTGACRRWLAPVVEAVQAMRGVGSIVAVTVVAEVGDFQRFDNPRQLMAYLGLTLSEHSSGASVRRGGITKAGCGLARCALIEGAWSCRMQARASPKLGVVAAGGRRHRPERTAQDVQVLSPSGCGRKGQGRRHHGHRARDGRLHLGYRPRHDARKGLKEPRTAAPDPV